MCFDQRLTTSVGCGAHMIRVYARYHSQCLTSSRGFHLNPRLPLLLPQCCLLCDGWVAPVLKMPNVAIISSFFFLGKFQVSDLMTSHPGQTCSSLKITGETVTDGDIVGFLNTGHHHRAGNIAVEVREGEGTGGTILKSQKHSYATADGARRQVECSHLLARF